jgi:hypothetical protein
MLGVRRGRLRRAAAAGGGRPATRAVHPGPGPARRVHLRARAPPARLRSVGAGGAVRPAGRPAAALDWRQAALAACLAHGGVAGFRTAAARYGLGRPPAVPEVLVRRTRRRGPLPAGVHSSGDLPETDRTLIGAVPATTPPVPSSTRAASCPAGWPRGWSRRRSCGASSTPLGWPAGPASCRRRGAGAARSSCASSMRCTPTWPRPATPGRRACCGSSERRGCQIRCRTSRGRRWAPASPRRRVARPAHLRRLRRLRAARRAGHLRRRPPPAERPRGRGVAAVPRAGGVGGAPGCGWGQRGERPAGSWGTGRAAAR